MLGRSFASVYDLNQPKHDAWAMEVMSGPQPDSTPKSVVFEANPLRPMFSEPGGTSVAGFNESRFYANDQIADPGAVNVYERSGDSWSEISTISSPSGLSETGFGATDAITISANYILIGGPHESNGTGAAYLYDATSGAYLGLQLLPYWMNSSGVIENDSADERGFGMGPSLISEGHYVVGSDPQNTDLPETLYNFRRRGPEWTESNDLAYPAELPTAKLGSDVDVDGDTAVLGAPEFDNRGAAYVLTLPSNGSEWVLETRLQPNHIDLLDNFGASAAVSGDTIVIGAPNTSDGEGAVYVFQRSGSAWTQQSKLVVDGASGFGWAVDIDVSTIVVGSEDGAYIFELDGSTWDTTRTPNLLEHAAEAVAIDGDTVVVGTPQDVTAFVYIDNGADWVEQGSVTGVAGAEFGRSVDISGDRVIVGAPGEDSGQGAAYVYQRSSGIWYTDAERGKLTMEAGQAGDFFGYSVAIDKQRVVVGAWGRDRSTLPEDANDGEAYVFGLRNDEWRLETITEALSGSGAEPRDMVGYAVGLSDGTAIVGAPELSGRIDLAIDTSGAGYSFLRSVSSPINVIVPERQQDLIGGAQANVLSGTVGGVETADFTFFDIGSVTIQTGNASDQLEIAEEGMTAYGLRQFAVNTGGSNDRLTTRSTKLTPPAVGTYSPFGDFGTTKDGDPIPPGAGYTKVTGGFVYDGGDDDDELVADGDEDWTLQADALVPTVDDRLDVNNVERASLIGGDTGNVIELLSWEGFVSLDGGAGSDQLIIDLDNVADSNVAESSGDGDQLRVLGTDTADLFTIDANSVSFGSHEIDYSGIDVLRIAGLDGNDAFSVADSSAATLFLDGGPGSDNYSIVDTDELSSTSIRISDSGPGPNTNGDVDTLFVPTESLPVVNMEFSVGGKTVLYDETIEEFQFSNITPILLLELSDDPDVIILDGNTLWTNGNPLDITDVTVLTVDSSGGDDQFRVVSVKPDLTVVAFDGGAGDNDTITIDANTANTWNITGLNRGDVAGANPFSFENIEHLVGGYSSNLFAFSNDLARISGDLAGRDGADTMDYSERDATVTIDLQTATATGIGGQFTDVEHFVGTDQTDLLIGLNTANTWSISDNNAGTINGATTFSSFENITGGASSDTFDLAAEANIEGLIDGAGGFNELILNMSNSARCGNGRCRLGIAERRYYQLHQYHQCRFECIWRRGCHNNCGYAFWLDDGRHR